MKQLIVTLGWLFVLFLIGLMVIAMIPNKAKAAAFPAYDLVMASYPSDAGHTIALRSYTDIFRAPYPDAESCEDAREYAVAKHEAHQNQKTMSTQLSDIFCLKNPGGGK